MLEPSATTLEQPVCSHYTGDMEKFHPRKSLKVSYIYLGFSPDKNNNEVKHSQRLSLEFLNPDLANSNEIL